MAAQRQPGRKTSTPTTHNRWDLSDLVKRPPIDVERSLVELGKLVGQVESTRPHLQATMASPDFLAILKLTETIAESSNRLGAFAYLWFSEDTKHASPARSKTKSRSNSPHSRTISCSSISGGKVSMKRMRSD